MEWLREAVTLLSLALTVPAVMGCIGVILLWKDSAVDALQQQERLALHWFILGVTVGFLGSLVDNVYWGIAWTADYLGHSSRDAWFYNGVYPNLIFRQACLSFAAYCHIRAAVATTHISFKVWVTFSWFAGILLALALVFTSD